MLLCDSYYFLDILWKPKFSQGFVDVLCSDGFLGLALGNLIRFGRDQGNKFDAAFNEQIAGFLSECCARADGKYLSDDFLNGSYTLKPVSLPSLYTKLSKPFNSLRE